MHISIMITPRRMLSDLILSYSYQKVDNKYDRLQSISSETIKDKWQALVTHRLAMHNQWAEQQKRPHRQQSYILLYICLLLVI